MKYELLQQIHEYKERALGSCELVCWSEVLEDIYIWVSSIRIIT